MYFILKLVGCLCLSHKHNYFIKDEFKQPRQRLANRANKNARGEKKKDSKERGGA